MRGNFLYVPTDCPQRDERLGWTGDIQVFAPTASLPLRRARLPRLVAAPTSRSSRSDAGGIVPFVVPNVLPGRVRPAAAWGDAATVVPWVLHERYGDAGVLARPVAEHAGLGRRARSSSPATGACGRGSSSSATGSTRPPRRSGPAEAKTDRDIVATAYLFRSADLTARAADAARARRATAERYAAHRRARSAPASAPST